MADNTHCSLVQYIVSLCLFIPFVFVFVCLLDACSGVTLFLFFFTFIYNFILITQRLITAHSTFWERFVIPLF